MHSINSQILFFSHGLTVCISLHEIYIRIKSLQWNRRILFISLSLKICDLYAMSQHKVKYCAYTRTCCPGNFFRQTLKLSSIFLAFAYYSYTVKRRRRIYSLCLWLGPLMKMQRSHIEWFTPLQILTIQNLLLENSELYVSNETIHIFVVGSLSLH